jgi:hypothetical protein
MWRLLVWRVKRAIGRVGLAVVNFMIDAADRETGYPFGSREERDDGGS